MKRRATELMKALRGGLVKSLPRRHAVELTMELTKGPVEEVRTEELVQEPAVEVRAEELLRELDDEARVGKLTEELVEEVRTEGSSKSRLWRYALKSSPESSAKRRVWGAHQGARRRGAP